MLSNIGQVPMKYIISFYLYKFQEQTKEYVTGQKENWYLGVDIEELEGYVHSGKIHLVIQYGLYFTFFMGVGFISTKIYLL